jgi:hypothetical protein
MRYEGRYEIFDPSAIQSYPLENRPNKVKLSDLVHPEQALRTTYPTPPAQQKLIDRVADWVIHARGANRPVVWMTGAHLIKNGLGPLLVDLVHRGMITLVATNGAGAIHDFELALVGETSEHVPNALPAGQFGMAYEFSYINAALNIGHEMNLGCGESLGRMICDVSFRQRVLAQVQRASSPQAFRHPEVSVLAGTYEQGVPMTVHAAIGTDVIDQHANFDGAAKGGTSGRDFLIFTQHITRLTEGGVVLNVGSAVTAPEVLLKAVSMAGNVGRPPRGLLTADFDLRPYDPRVMADESAAGYYFRDQKSIVTRIPKAFGGEGLYIHGDQRVTLPALYQAIIRRLT